MGESTGRVRAALEGRYRIERELGHGGMATVYLAEDEKHRRKVAVKVLRPDLAATLGPDRFLREIELAAQLTHPHILPLHDSGEADGFLYYVMPYIDGESLRERIANEGELPVADAVRIIKEVVDALAYAHSLGVVHRDIKPDNVMLQGRHAMVADFGVAKAVSEATGRQQLTTAGVALGTPAYMAPEQAAADPHIDHRADIYAIGAMAYELLTGRPPFTGTTPQQVLSAHVTQAPEPISKRRETIPAALEQVIMRCLEKRAADRWQTADELLPHLEGLGTPSGGMTPTGTIPVTGVRPRRRVNVATLTGVTVAVAVLGFLGWSSVRRAAPTLTVSNIRQLTRLPELEIEPAISPDGREVAYTAGFGRNLHIYVRDLGGGRALALTAERPGAQWQPRWTADGREVVFWERRPGVTPGAFLVPRLGGQARSVSDAAVWATRGDSALVSRAGSLLVQPLGGGAPVMASVTGGHSVDWSPDGDRIAFVTGNGSFISVLGELGNIAASAIWVVSRDGSEPFPVVDNGALNMSPVWMPDGRHILYVSNLDGPRDVYAIRMDGDGRPEGVPVRVTTSLDPHSISLSQDGRTLAYSRFTFRRNVWAIDIPPSGTVSIAEARALTVGNQAVENHGVSLDGRWLAFDSDLHGNQDIYVVSTDGGEPRRLTTDPGNDFHPDYSPDGSEIVFYSMRHGTRDIFLMRSDGTNEVRLTDDPGEELHPSFSPDGLHVTYLCSGRLCMLSRETVGGAWSEPVEVGAVGQRWSPDGTRLIGTRGGALYVSPLDGDGVVLADSTTGLSQIDWPYWSADGRSVYFQASDTSGAHALYTIPASGGRPRAVVLFDDSSKQVRFGMSVHGTRAYFSVTEYESDIWVMELEVR